MTKSQPNCVTVQGRGGSESLDEHQKGEKGKFRQIGRILWIVSLEWVSIYVKFPRWYPLGQQEGAGEQFRHVCLTTTVLFVVRLSDSFFPLILPCSLMHFYVHATSYLSGPFILTGMISEVHWILSVWFPIFQHLMMFLYHRIYFAPYFQCTLPVQKLDANEIWLSCYLGSAYTCPVARKAVFLWNSGKTGYVYHTGL